MWNKYYIAASLPDALGLLRQDPSASKIFAGGTDLMLEIKRGLHSGKTTIIDISCITELHSISRDAGGDIHIGALVTHNDIASSSIIQNSAHALAEACFQVGSPQIRNRGTIGGNLVTASPANDTIPALIALNAELVLISASSERTVRLEDFYTGVRKTILASDELLKEIIIKARYQGYASSFYKFALRNAQAISVVNAAVAIKVSNSLIEDARVAVGSVAPTVVRLKQIESKLIGSAPDTAAGLITTAPLEEATPITDVRASDQYRQEMVRVIVKRCIDATLFPERAYNQLPTNPVTLTGSPSNNADKPIESTILIDEYNPIKTTINGYSYVFPDAYQKTLLDLIRDNAGLTGSKEGCAEGECGACTVFLEGNAVMSCLIPSPRAHLAAIETIESISGENSLHPVQEAFIEEGAVQCGYCTPGFVMSAVKLLEERKHPNEQEIKDAITGNLCRCTGYYKIIKAIEKAAEKG